MECDGGGSVGNGIEKFILEGMKSGASFLPDPENAFPDDTQSCGSQQ